MREAKPFKPFEIHLNDGHTLVISNPDYLYIFPESTEFIVARPNSGYRHSDVSQVLSINHSKAPAGV